MYFRIRINRGLFCWDAKGLESCVLVGYRHGFICRLVAAVHGLAVGCDCVDAAIFSADEVELSPHCDVKQRTAVFACALT